ncbi:tumor necrosis factor ligand superfamily member 14-like [Myripristis murdjan]|uniref:tumor necrosis factor ligand superfamily member 14-like n=1 Tax=Myripristis murdjan TaxID=586833 RepID=UPI0011763246|nr:tumor necrosis factor ligand superfamily member 14-like [Myripristis murdjan]XP_029917707.1 tumor necrosis factor ligand superfamily member 14-like [Myripristis murdjan]
MAEACPQVFVVDSQANYAALPSGKNAKGLRVSQRVLLFLVGLALFGLVVEACFIFYMYRKIESSSLCHNVSNTKPSPQLGGTLQSRIGPNESNEIPPLPTGRTLPAEPQRRPSAHLMGSKNPVNKNIVQWTDADGDAFTYRMEYNGSHLVVQEDGYYYLYSKVYFAAEECSAIKHKVMKHTEAYDESMELMKSNRLHCHSPRAQMSQKPVEDLWNSFLGGIFHLQPGDKIFVTLEDGKTMRPGSAENFMGAFMI